MAGHAQNGKGPFSRAAAQLLHTADGLKACHNSANKMALGFQQEVREGEATDINQSSTDINDEERPCFLRSDGIERMKGHTSLVIVRLAAGRIG